MEGIARLSRCDLVLAGPEAPEASRIRPADVLAGRGAGPRAAALAGAPPGLAPGAGASPAGLRSLVAEQIIQDFSKVNAQFALMTAVPQALPVVAPFFPPVVIADMWVLTKNQVMMIIRLAAAYGAPRSPGRASGRSFRSSARPLAGRSLARELVGLVPGGVGVALKATHRLQRAPIWPAARPCFYYQVGRRPTRIELKGFRREGAARPAPPSATP